MTSADSVNTGISRDGQISPCNKGQDMIQNTTHLNVLFCVKKK